MSSTIPSGPLSKFWDNLEAMISDITTLDVVTLTGDIDVTLNQQADAGGAADPAETITFQDILKNIQAVKSQGLNAVAVTHIEVDMDTALFVKDNLTPQQQNLLTLHNQSVEQARNARHAFIQATLEAFKIS
ncbi:hypothetical protein [Acanthopleuribacter pedis]|uniref:Uncharacterized protein n=1 Tax=Acanthopleuribacter pedis TaxID=442870 RepID=A0A8J7U5T6_9BACT|nr:hypothetical protein [Acanthopleuribacter pedis]MBO1320803.1 hypothetical protein [Acanthopleuribacter pedis]